MRRAIRTLRQKGVAVDQAAWEAVAAQYSVGLSGHVLDRIATAHDAVGLQYLPDRRELESHPSDRADPIGDGAHSPVKGIVHRYANRVLLMPIEICAVYCRFCFRREKVGQDGHGLLSEHELDAALEYIRAMPAIQEVILTGGDPFVLSPRRLGHILEALDAIDHVRIIRLHSRVPAADPVRVNDAVCAVLARVDKPVYIVVHINHAQEFSVESDALFRRLRRLGCILLSQSVLLKGVNDSAEALGILFQGLVERGVKPYYLHHPDLAPGTAHFRLDPAEGQALMKAVRGMVSGLAMPLYVLDIPGGFGKVPLQSSHLARTGKGGYCVEDIHGVSHDYDPGAL